jgi:hypothetical protein
MAVPADALVELLIGPVAGVQVPAGDDHLAVPGVVGND